MQWVIHKDSGIKKIDGIRGMNVSAMGEYSFVGFIFLKLKLEAIGINLEKENNVYFLENSDNIIFSALNGKANVGIVRFDVLKDVRYSIYILGHPFVVTKNMDGKLKNKIKNALINYTIPENGSKLGINKILPATNKDY